MRRITSSHKGRCSALRVFVAMLLIAMAFFAWISVSGFDQAGHPRCDDNGKCYSPDDETEGSTYVSQDQADPHKRFATLEGDTDLARPGQTVNRTIVGNGSSSLPMTITYTPPYGATNLSFDPPPEPGGPPYVWKNVGDTGDLITIQYDTPPIEGDWTEWTAVETVQSTAGDPGSERTDRYETTILANQSGGVADRSNPTPDARAARTLDALTTNDPETVTVWTLTRWTEFPGMPLDSEEIRRWAEWLAADDVFFAVRLPVQASAVPTRSVPLPYFTDPEHPASLRVEVYGGEILYQTALELRAERMTFAANALPAAEGETWTTLGVSGNVPVVPDGLSAVADGWSMIAEFSFDLSSQPDAGAGLIQPLYYCYDNGDRPYLSRQVRAMAYALGMRYEGGLQATTYPEWCITCMGPEQVSTVTGGYGWGLGSAHSDIVVAGDVMTFCHTLSAMRGADAAVTFAVSSTLDLGWTLYEGDPLAPDLESPITGTYTVTAGHVGRVWLVSDPVPTSAADGPYSVMLTAEDGEGATRWASDVFWVGDWVSPVDKGYTLCVPLIIRGY